MLLLRMALNDVQEHRVRTMTKRTDMRRLRRLIRNQLRIRDMETMSGSTKLQVTPHIINTLGKPQIQLVLDVKDESVTPNTGEGNKSKLDSSSISTQAVVYEGQSVLVGGYFKETFMDGNSGVPFLKELPFIGGIFKNTTKNKGTSERLFLITPKIIRMSAGEDKFGGLFATPSTLMKPEERVSMEYLNAEKQFLASPKSNTRAHRSMGKYEEKF